MKKLAQYNRNKLIDVLNERLKFERTGVKLYDAILEKVRGLTESPVEMLVSDLEQFRAQEKEHEEWLEEQIRSLGGDAQAETDLSALVERENQGIADVITHDVELPHLFHALLTAELADNNGWLLLVHLADEADDEIARKAFSKRLHEEEDHLDLMRKVVETFTRRDVFGALEAPSL